MQWAGDYLYRWGEYELLHRLLSLSVRTLTGHRRAVALVNLANVHQHLGDCPRARDYYQRVLAESQAAGKRANTAAVLHPLGMLHQCKESTNGPATSISSPLAIKAGPG